MNLLYRLRCSLPFLRDRPTRIRGGPLKSFLWLPRSGDVACIQGTYEPAIQEVFLRHIKPGDVVYDLGANHGYFSLLASTRVGKAGKVFAFEPLPKSVRGIVTHSGMNRIDNIFPCPYAISGTNGRIAITNLADHLANTIIMESPLFSALAPTVQVEARTLDRLATEGLPPPQFMKIDIEGAEYDALLGAREILGRHRPLLCISVHENHRKGVEKQCLEFLADFNYSLTLIDTNKVTPGIRDYLAIPKERAVPGPKLEARD